ncbi:EamA-like transporter family protein [Nitrospirillum amazonense]|uniref:EamA-like transporter family protein n=1 Tax=Nitrospirillum amazonense TaxID=28077 RepID=A0A560FH26_9PROT|nr:EamA family transporter [Nitrospirillum amazonense]TWB20907.1 EamA-like transporter family protein [Nitrospirillum amazonense]
MSPILGLYLTAVLIWGSTWYVIEFQLGAVDPAVSVAYRFGLAAVLLMGWLVARGQKVIPPRHAWRQVALVGAFTFSTNYLLVYLATERLPSGLVAVAGSALSLMNVLNARIFLRQPVRPLVLLGGLIGMTGVVLLFLPELQVDGLTGKAAVGLALVMLSNVSASLGSICVQRGAKLGVPLLPATAWSMAFGAVLMVGVALARGAVFSFPASLSYTVSLGYLALFGSVIAFLAYFSLIGRIGADRAGYVAVMIPILALVISTVFEGYHWSPAAFIGLALAVAGNLLVLGPRTWRKQDAAPAPAPAR